MLPQTDGAEAKIGRAPVIQQTPNSFFNAFVIAFDFAILAHKVICRCET
jgi:hypothetical protein